MIEFLGWLFIACWLVVPMLSMPPLFSASGSVIFDTNGANTLIKLATVSATDWSTGSVVNYNGISGFSGTVRFAFDRKNNVIYASNTGSGDIVKRDASDLSGSAWTAVVTLTNPIYAIECDPTNSRLFVLCWDGSTTADLRKLNYDGTGDTQLKSWGLTALGNFRNSQIQYDATADKIYYIKLFVSGGKDTADIRFINPNGTGDTLIENVNDLSGGGSACDLTIDATNRYLFWAHGSGISSQPHRVRRSDMSGSGITTIFNFSGIGNPVGFIRFSQRLGKLYLLDGTAIGGSTPFASRMNNDGSSTETLATVSSWFDGTIDHFALTGDLETTGAGAIL